MDIGVDVLTAGCAWHMLGIALFCSADESSL
jgi:hypothetical protein